MKTIKTFLVQDQYGELKILEGTSIRSLLTEYTGIKHISKMYIDRKDGSTHHIGYVLGRQWFNVYECHPMDKAVSRS